MTYRHTYVLWTLLLCPWGFKLHHVLMIAAQNDTDSAETWSIPTQPTNSQYSVLTTSKWMKWMATTVYKHSLIANEYDTMQRGTTWRCLCRQYEFYQFKEANTHTIGNIYWGWSVEIYTPYGFTKEGWPNSLHFASLTIPQKYSTRSMYLRDRVGHIRVHNHMFCKLMEKNVTHEHVIPTYIL